MAKKGTDPRLRVFDYAHWHKNIGAFPSTKHVVKALLSAMDVTKNAVDDAKQKSWKDVEKMEGRICHFWTDKMNVGCDLGKVFDLHWFKLDNVSTSRVLIFVLPSGDFFQSHYSFARAAYAYVQSLYQDYYTIQVLKVRRQNAPLSPVALL